MKRYLPLPMTDAEILHSFNNAAVPAKQVKILAELNATTQPRIREILVKMGVDPRRLPRERKPKPDGLTAKVTIVDELHTVDPVPSEEVQRPTRSELCAGILTCVSDMLDKLTASKAALSKEIEELATLLKAKQEELAEIEKLIPVLLTCKTEVELI